MILGVDGTSAFDGPPPALPRPVQGVITDAAMELDCAKVYGRGGRRRVSCDGT